LSKIETHFIPDSAPKIAMGARVSPVPSIYLRVGPSTIENSCNTIENNWSKLTLKIGMGLGKHSQAIKFRKLLRRMGQITDFA